MINVLFFGNPSSIHDLKWIRSLKSKGDLNAFFIFENGMSNADKQSYTDLGVQIGPALNSFSLFKWGQNLKTYYKISRFVKENKIQLVHVFIGTSHVIIPSFLKTPVLLTTRGTDVNNTLKGLAAKNTIKDRFLFKALSSSYKRVNQIMSTSNTQIKVLNDLIPGLVSKPLLIRTGVDLAGVEQAMPYNISESGGKEIVLFIRNIHANYDPLLSVAAVVNLSKCTIKSNHFVFMKGKNHDLFLQSEMKIKLEESDISFTLMDPIDNVSVWGVIQASSLIVMNPITDGTPNSAIEAMAAHKKTIMGYCDYDKDLFNNQTTHFLKKRDHIELRDLIEKVLKLDDKSRVENAYQNVLKRASQSTEMDKVITLYKSFMS